VKPNIKSQIAQELMETGKVQSFRVFDTHGHMGGFAAIYFPNASTDRMIATMDRCGVEWLAFAHHDALQNSDSGNRKAQEAVDAYPDRLLAYYAVNPNYPDLIREGIEKFDSLRGFAGYKILGSYYNVSLLDPRAIPVWEHAQENKLAMLLHTWGGGGRGEPAQVEEAAKRFPEVRILMGHSLYGDWDTAIRLAKENEHVYCELTAAYGATGLIKKMVDAGVEDRILFGTDLPWFDPMVGIGCIVFADISDAARRKILRDNAEELFARWIN
jgi:predicted TIM-barrel fold metal-dependent hydrolase